MSRIHPLACVDAAAQIADDAEIGPYCVIGPHVKIADGCRLISHVRVEGHTTVGSRTAVYPQAALGTAPQSLGYRGEPTRLAIGADCQIREGVTMNIGTADGGGMTAVGERCFFMANAHVAHDCRVGNDVIFANCATLGGHCEIGDFVFIGGLSAVHQHTRVGAYAMIGGVSGVRGDVIPFGLANGQYARLAGINAVGMRRRQFAHSAIVAVRRAFRHLFFATAPLEERLRLTEAELGDEPTVAQIVSFVRSRGKRALCQPGRAASHAGD
jgi:UDP-N-acetylglucosamine acyltransferase